jgi:hypothetical protein
MWLRLALVVLEKGNAFAVPGLAGPLLYGRLQQKSYSISFNLPPSPIALIHLLLYFDVCSLS